jgi:hypothetical protein
VWFVVETWKLIITTVIKNCFVKYGFSYDHISSSNNAAVELRQDQQDDLHILQLLGVQCGATVCMTVLMSFAESRVSVWCQISI